MQGKWGFDLDSINNKGVRIVGKFFLVRFYGNYGQTSSLLDYQ